MTRRRKLDAASARPSGRASAASSQAQVGRIYGAELLGKGGPLQVHPAIQRFVVTFTDWTAYRLEIEAESADQAIELAQAMSTGDLWEAEARNGGQENWDAFPVPTEPFPGGAGGVMSTLPGIAVRVAELNDRFRRTLSGGQGLCTRGVADRGELFVCRALAAVRGFEAFTPDNDLWRTRLRSVHPRRRQAVLEDRHLRRRQPDLRGGRPDRPEGGPRADTLMLAEEY